MRGGVLTLEVRALEVLVVGGDPDPRQRVDDPLRPLGAVAGLVGVLDPQHEGTAEAASQRPVVQRRARPTDVERAGRRRRETEARAIGHAALDAIGAVMPTSVRVGHRCRHGRQREVPQLTQRDRQRGEIEHLGPTDLGVHREGTADGAFVRFDPRRR